MNCSKCRVISPRPLDVVAGIGHHVGRDLVDRDLRLLLDVDQRAAAAARCRTEQAFSFSRLLDLGVLLVARRRAENARWLQPRSGPDRSRPGASGRGPSAASGRASIRAGPRRPPDRARPARARARRADRRASSSESSSRRPMATCSSSLPKATLGLRSSGWLSLLLLSVTPTASISTKWVLASGVGRHLLQVVGGSMTGAAALHLLEVEPAADVAHEEQALRAA